METQYITKINCPACGRHLEHDIVSGVTAACPCGGKRVNWMKWVNVVFWVCLLSAVVIGCYRFAGLFALKACGLVAVATLAYFLPSIIAHRRHRKNQNAILVLNFFLGWTLLGWIGALVWAYVEDK